MAKIVTITGELGSGKSTVSKALAKFWHCKRYSTGDVQRDMAQEMGVTTLAFNLMADQDPEIDKKIDSVFADLGHSSEDIIIDSRLAWHFVPHSLKVKLNVSGDEAVYRIQNDQNRVSEDTSDALLVHKNLLARRSSERSRFLSVYQVDVEDDNNFDIVIDSGSADVSTIVKLIDDAWHKKEQGIALHRHWAAAISLYPTEPVRKLVLPEAINTRNMVTDNGFDKIHPVLVARDKKNNNFIFAGHEQTSAAILAGVEMIPIKVASDRDIGIKGSTIESFIQSNFNLSLIYDWEDAHDFNFRHYPSKDIGAATSPIESRLLHLG